MPEASGGTTLVIVLGNELRGDDGAGPLVAALLEPRGIAAVAVAGEPIAVLDLWHRAGPVILIDAVAGAEPGRIHRWEPGRAGAPAIFGGRPSTHLFGLADVLELAAALDRLPSGLTVIGIEGDSFAMGTRPSPAVERAAGIVAAAVAAEIRPAPAGPCGLEPDAEHDDQTRPIEVSSG